MCEKVVKERAHVQRDCEEEETVCAKTCARRLPRRAKREDCEKRSWPAAAVCERAPKLAHVRGDRGG